MHCHTYDELQGVGYAADQDLSMQGLLGPHICQQLGQEALDSAVTQTAGLLPRDLQALAADAAAAAAARGLDTLRMLPALRAVQAPDTSQLLQQSLEHSSDSGHQAEPVSIWKDTAKAQHAAVDGQQGGAQTQEAALSGQHESMDPVQVSGADVQMSLDRVRQRTATTIGAPKVGPPMLCRGHHSYCEILCYCCHNPKHKVELVPFWPQSLYSSKCRQDI